MVTHRVHAIHPTTGWDMVDEPIAVYESAQGPGVPPMHYAVHPELGCGKDYDTPVDAIRNLLEDHAYTVIKIEEE